MPNTNNTPFTWGDAQWLNTQVTNCIDRSTQAVAIAEQALALIKSDSGVKLLSKTIGLNLNPTITLTYTSLVGTFAVGSSITNVHGSTAVILTDNGSNSMTLTNITLAAGFETLSGTITASAAGSTVTATVSTFNWGDQGIALTGGNKFIITDIVLTNASAVPVHASDGEWWSLTGRTGINLANTKIFTGSIGGLGGLGGGTVLPFPLANASQYMSFANFDIAYPNPSFGNSLSTSGSVLYFTLGTPEGTALTCDMYIYGYILS